MMMTWGYLGIVYQISFTTFNQILTLQEYNPTMEHGSSAEDRDRDFQNLGATRSTFSILNEGYSE